MAFMNSNLGNLGDPVIWHELYNKYGVSASDTNPNSWSTIYWYEGVRIPDSLANEAANASWELLASISVWDSSAKSTAERALIIQLNYIRTKWGWYGQISSSEPRLPKDAPPVYVPPPPPVYVPPPPPVYVPPPAPVYVPPIKPEAPILQPATVSDAGYSLEGPSLTDKYGEPIEAGFFTPINLLIMSLIGGLGYYVYTKKFAKPNTVSY